jgi:hypothetical protein
VEKPGEVWMLCTVWSAVSAQVSALIAGIRMCVSSGASVSGA